MKESPTLGEVFAALDAEAMAPETRDRTDAEIRKELEDMLTHLQRQHAGACKQRDVLGAQLSQLLQRFYGLQVAFTALTLDGAAAAVRAEIDGIENVLRGIATEHGMRE